jgi:3-dehydroquinate synthase
LESNPHASSGSNAVTAIRVRAGRSAHDLIVGAGLLNETGARVRSVMQAECCTLISDTNVAPLFGDRIKRSLESANFQPTLITIPAGEKSKTLEQAAGICETMIAAGLDRQSFVIGLGGGMIGDISGFVAAIYHRGIPHVQIPTTLLAMVDSSIGGKTGVNTSDGKNLIGAFHHPLLVIDDVELLKKLPPREFNQGFAEMTKHAIVADAEMFGALKNTQANNPLALQSLIKRNVEIKSRIIAKDERDQTGERAILNFGHTVGHAIERAGDYRKFLHGEAVSLGIVAACTISIKRAGLPQGQRDAIVDLLRQFNLPTQLPKSSPREKIIQTLKLDKKFEGGKVRFVVTPRIGIAHLTNDVRLDDIREAVDEL